jgi:hypothetical protein
MALDRSILDPMIKSIEERVKDSFESSDSDQVFKYLELMRQTRDDYAGELRRLSTVLILLVAVFELVENGKNTIISVSSFQFSRHSVVMIFVPALAAYLFCQLSIDSTKSDRIGHAFNSTFRLWCPKGADNDLDILVQGPAPLYANSSTFSSRKFGGLTEKVEDIGGLTFIVVLLLGVFAFEGQAYYVLFSYSILWFVSVVLTVYLLVFGIIVYFQESGDAKPGPSAAHPVAEARR